MKKFLLLLILLPVAGGITWYESRPTTVKVPMAIEEAPIAVPIYEEPVTTTTAIPKPLPKIDFSKVRLHLEVQGVDGDNINLVQMIHEPQELSHIPRGIQDVMQNCGVVATDRDRLVRVDTKVELASSLPADVNVDYRTTGLMAVYQLSDGPICKDDGHVVHHLRPGHANVFSYWVVIQGFITPEATGGDYSKSWYIGAPVLTLPNLELMHWKLWGSNVGKCDGLLGETARITLAGRFTGALDGCQPAVSQDQATGG